MTTDHHHCEIIHQSLPGGHYMLPHYVLHVAMPLMVVGTSVLFTVLVVGFLMLFDRTRLTPVVRARTNAARATVAVENALAEALGRFGPLNSL